jgi:plastocyanin
MMTAAVGLLGVALLGLPASTAAASQRGTVEKIQAQDDCNPASFNKVLGPGACVRPGDTTFDELIAQLQEKGAAHKWRFHSDDIRIRPGGVVEIRNVGGEFHTFTEVMDFGGGCVPELNTVLGLTPVPECDALAPDGVTPLVFLTTGIAPKGPGSSLKVSGLKPGLHHFQCMIHPWMHADVLVRR